MDYVLEKVYSCILEQVLVRWTDQDEALYDCAKALMRDSRQSPALLAQCYGFEGSPEYIEGLAGELYAHEAALEALNVQKEGDND